jgi:hypothetical protein
MPYIGAKELKASDIRRFDVTSSTSAMHTLTWTPPTEQSLIVTINGIKQHEDAYSVSGTTLTLSSPLVASDKLEVIGINDIGTTITPAQNSVDTDKIANNAVTTVKIADDQITSAKLANAINITSGNSLTIDSGATITNNGTASGFGGTNTPAFFAGRTGSDQTLTSSAYTKLQFNEEAIDTHSAYDNSTNYRFTVPSGQAGKYYVSVGATFGISTSSSLNAWLYIFKNGSNSGSQVQYLSATRVSATKNAILDLSVGDYIEAYAWVSGSGTLTFVHQAAVPGMGHFTAFKLVE